LLKSSRGNGSDSITRERINKNAISTGKDRKKNYDIHNEQDSGSTTRGQPVLNLKRQQRGTGEKRVIKAKPKKKKLIKKGEKGGDSPLNGTLHNGTAQTGVREKKTVTLESEQLITRSTHRQTLCQAWNRREKACSWLEGNRFLILGVGWEGEKKTDENFIRGGSKL